MKNKWLKANVFYRRITNSEMSSVYDSVLDREIKIKEYGVYVRGKPNDLVTLWPWHMILEIDLIDQG